MLGGGKQQTGAAAAEEEESKSQKERMGRRGKKRKEERKLHKQGRKEAESLTSCSDAFLKQGISSAAPPLSGLQLLLQPC